MQFEFATATRISFGEGKRLEAIEAARSFGKRGFLAVGRNPERAEWLRAALAAEGIVIQSGNFPGEPTIQQVDAASRAARDFGARFVIAIGGGSVIDAGKAVAAMLPNPGPLLDHLEVIGKALPLPQPPLPYIAIPTTAGTGAEVTRNAVLGSPEHHLKVSLRSASMLPRLAIVDPELTYDLPPAITAWTGMDALTQLIEPYLSARRTPLVDGLCREAIPRAARSLEKACQNGADPEPRRDMALASLFSGLALANAGLGAVHGFAAPIGGMYHAPHGAVCAALLPGVLRANYQHCLKDKNPELLERFRQIAQWLTGRPEAKPEAGIEWVEQLIPKLQIPKLSRWGVHAEHAPEISRKAAQASSMKANPFTLTHEQLEQILHTAI